MGCQERIDVEEAFCWVLIRQALVRNGASDHIAFNVEAPEFVEIADLLGQERVQAPWMHCTRGGSDKIHSSGGFFWRVFDFLAVCFSSNSGPGPLNLLIKSKKTPCKSAFPYNAPTLGGARLHL